METSASHNNGDGSQPQVASDSDTNQDLLELVARYKAELAEVAPLLERARKHLDEIATAKAQVEGMVAEIGSKVTDVQNTAAAALAADLQIASELASAKTAVEAVGTVKAASVGLLSEIETQLAGATAGAQAAAAGKALIDEASTSATAALEAVLASKASAGDGVEDIQLRLKAGEEHVAKLKALSDVAGETQARISYYEQRLLDFDGRAAKQLETITGLLPGATSAGLASAFDLRRQSFLKPSTRWQWLFVGSVVALVLLALTGFWSVNKGSVLDPLAIFSMWLVRLPIAAALVWLALHSSRESALAKRLEEDYGYKAAMAASFQGFQKQMAEINESAGPDSPLRKLCEDTLATIASPPGRIYEKQSLTVTPGSEFAGAASKVGAAVGNASGVVRPNA